MQYILLFVVVIFNSSQSLIQKQYNIKTQATNVFSFCGLTCFFALLFFVASAFFSIEFQEGSLIVNKSSGINFDPGIIIYAVGFSITYAAATLGGFLALKYGPLGITLLIGSYSLLVPTFYGIIFLKDPISYTTYIGLALLAVSLFCLNFKNEKINFSLKWLVCVILSFIGNGMCSTVQRMQQVAFDGEGKNELMIVALIISVILFFIIALVRKEKFDIRQSLPYAAPKGIANGIVNLFVMALQAVIPTAIFFPVISAGGIITGFFVSIYVYKEKLSKLQYFGYALGVLSVILLNLK